MAKAWLSLGANIGDPAAQLAEAVRRIGAADEVTVTQQSKVIITKPWGKTDQPDFANMALEVETALEPLRLLDLLQAIETAMGRVRHETWGPRVIDIDIVAYERQVLETERLTLPHPFAHERAFVLDPLAEIAPETAAWLVGRTAGPA
ncbi:MAG TPA: 2-amino-4-hydroxy-6-hydroxymethyldihydropteridine diphosphokinase [Devosia sp.]|jgi:2-amino-4-hydroxy-6-hydroxymethyldihydropteridine diphosphokinase|uniref:2-amino-4-hydroxy-6- hydroxymethyldihydropteridine diphosphokinase n=1 Tax=Devosia sp. TaxID=1871048 RepID=UPI002F927290